MKISVITATYNSGKFLESAIESVAEQSYNDIEYIIVDGGSTDNTLQIIKDHKSVIYKYISEKDEGIYFALNKGIKHATGEIICFLHSDDKFASPDVLQTVADCFLRTDADVVYGDLIYNSRERENKLIRYWKAGEFKKHSMFFGWMPPHTATFIKSKIYSQIGLFNTDLKISADYELILRIFSIIDLKVDYIPQLMIKMRVGGISNGSISDIIQKSREDYLGLKLNKKPFPAISLVFKNIRKITQLINF
ncbi:MAG: glycosyltransferase [Melioribacteraceae bacterium]|nr:glycosyltransferase [Melioribacteraceae bacterium]